MTSNSRYREQYDRMKRWHDRLVSLDQGRAHNVSSENYLDEIYAFFQNCYHLKDWIKNDGAVPLKKRAVEDYINNSRPLRLCADLCNALKHLTLKDEPRSGENPAFGKEHYSLTLGGESPTISLKYEVTTVNGPEDAFQLATKCVREWDAFFARNGLT
jgi:hypothetical protein